MLSPMRLPSSPTHLSLGHLWGLSCVADHVRSWGWRPRNANPPRRLRKVPFLPAQKENNKELSVAAACGAQRTHQNTSKSRCSPPALSQPASQPSIHPCATPLPSNTQSPRSADPLFNRWGTLMVPFGPSASDRTSRICEGQREAGPSRSRFTFHLVLFAHWPCLYNMIQPSVKQNRL